jgi:hypothetical protein
MAEEPIQDPAALNGIDKKEDRDGRMMSQDPDNSNSAQTDDVEGTERRGQDTPSSSSAE